MTFRSPRNQLSSDNLTIILENTELSCPQRAQVSAASDKVTMYSKIMRIEKARERTVSIAVIVSAEDLAIGLLCPR
jgi:hypothetical protein